MTVKDLKTLLNDFDDNKEVWVGCCEFYNKAEFISEEDDGITIND